MQLAYRVGQKVEIDGVKKTLKQIYVVRGKNYAFNYPVLDKDGNVQYQTNNVTGGYVMENGQPLIIERMERFETIEARLSVGTLAAYFVWDNTDKSIAKRLAILEKDSGSGVITYDQWLKENKPEYYNELMRRGKLEDELEKRVSEAVEGERAKIKRDIESSKNKEIEALKKKIASIEGGKK